MEGQQGQGQSAYAPMNPMAGGKFSGSSMPMGQQGQGYKNPMMSQRPPPQQQQMPGSQYYDPRYHQGGQQGGQQGGYQQ